MRIRVWSPVQVVPDVTGTEQHTGQMFVVDTCSKNRICMATKRNIKHEGASKWPIYIQITVSLRLCRALLSTNGQGKPRRPGGLESDSRCCRGVSGESLLEVLLQGHDSSVFVSLNPLCFVLCRRTAWLKIHQSPADVAPTASLQAAGVSVCVST